MIKHIYVKLICVLSGIITLFLLFCALVSTTQVTKGGSLFFLKDSIIVNILVVFAFGIIIFWGAKVSKNSERVRKYVNKINTNILAYNQCERVLLTVIFIIGVVWIFAAQTGGRSDDRMIQEAVYAARIEDFDRFELSQYMDRFPNQIGFFAYSFLLSLVFGSFNYLVIQLINLFGLIVFYKEMCKILEHMKFKPIIRIIYLLVSITFFPLITYVSYAYGTILGLSFSVMAIRRGMDYIVNRKLSSATISVVCIIIACLLKNNYLIFAIGMILYLLIKIIDAKEKSKLIGYLAGVLLGVSFTMTLPGWIGLNGQSSTVWVAMGLSEGDNGPGWSNPVDRMYYNNPADKKLQSKEAMQIIFERCNQFVSEPAYGVSFFNRKNASQWNAPLFQFSYVNAYENDESDRSEWVNLILSQDGERLLLYAMNYWYIIFLVGVVIYMVSMWKSADIETTIFPCLFLGAFVFHSFWEARALYTISYIAILIPLSIKGYLSLIVNKESKEYIKLTELRIPFTIFAITFLTICGINSYLGYGYLICDNENYNIYIEEQRSLSSYLPDGEYIFYTEDNYPIPNEKKNQHIKVESIGNAVYLKIEGNGYITYNMNNDTASYEGLHFYDNFQKWYIQEGPNNTINIHNGEGKFLAYQDNHYLLGDYRDVSEMNWKWENVKN